MFELNAADYSLLSWIQQAGVPVHSLSVRFHPGCLMVHCQTLEQAMRLWEKRSNLQIGQKDLCFRVDDQVYVGATMS